MISDRKLCVLCKHIQWDWDEGSNCDTCGYDAFGVMKCNKGHWEDNVHSGEDLLSGLLKAIYIAETCKDFTPLKK